MTAPTYQQIKDFISSKIMQGIWREGALIPSENELSKTFSVARMTVNRALRELANEQWITRIQGVGTFVSQKKYQSTLVEIKSISDEVAERNHQHSTEVIELSEQCADEFSAKALELSVGMPIFYSLLLHFDNQVPLQLEERWVNPIAGTNDYLKQDFTKITPSQYLIQHAPLQKVEYQIEAVMPSERQVALLKMHAHEPCLVLLRRTWSNERIVSVAKLVHPACRYSFSGYF